MRRFFILIMFFAAFNVSLSQTDDVTLFQSTNMDFELGKSGEMPLGWVLTYSSRERGYIARLSEDNPYAGRFSFELAHKGPYKEDMYGSVMQSIDAKPYQGRKVKLRAAVRAEIASERGSAHIWIREHYIGGTEGKFEFMEDKPIIFNNWAIYEIEMEIEKFTGVINYGLILFGTGSAWIDNVSIDIIHSDPSANEPPRELSDRGLENLIAFSDIFGYVRYFHPSKEAQSANWDQLSILGVQEVESATDAQALTKTLDRLFQAIAPGIVIFPKNKKPLPQIKKNIPENALKNISISWIQNIAGLEVKDSRIKSRVVNVYESQRERPATVLQTLDAEMFRGYRIAFTAFARTDLIGPESQAQLWIRIDGESNNLLSSATMDDNPIIEKKWKKYRVEIDVPDEAVNIRLGLVLIGEGKVWFDDTEIEVVDSGKILDTYKPKNNDFEIGIPDEVVRNWVMPQSSKRAGYEAVNTKDKPHGGKQCLLIYSDTASRFLLPSPGEIVKADAGSELSFYLQISLFLDSLRTLPYPPEDIEPFVLNRPDDFVMNPSDRASRLATIITAWNFFRHFNLFGLDKKELYDILKIVLRKAALDKNESEFLLTLRKLTAILGDSQARVWFEKETSHYGLPILWREISGKVIITKVGEGIKGITPGDEVIEYNGKSIKDTLNSLGIYISAATQSWRNLVALAMLRSGDLGSIIKLKIKGKSGKIAEFSIDRSVHISAFREDKLEPFMEILPGILYIDMMRSSDKQLLDSLVLIKTAKAIIFDARGISNITEHAFALFVQEQLPSFIWKVPQFTMPDRKLVNYRTITSTINPSPHRTDCKLYFLSDESSIGYSEAILGIVKHYELGEIIGSESAGSPGDIIAYRLPCNYYLSLTGAQLYMPDKSLLFGKGVQPTILLKPDTASFARGTDLLIERALIMIDKSIGN